MIQILEKSVYTDHFKPKGEKSVELIQSTLFIVFGVLVRIYSRGTSSNVQRHVQNLFILAAIVWLVIYQYLPYWKLVVLIGYVTTNIYAVKTIIEKQKTKEFVHPPTWIAWFSVSCIVAGLIYDQMHISIMFSVLYFSVLIVLEKTNKKYQKLYGKNVNTKPIDDREKIIERIKKEGIAIEKWFSYSPNQYGLMHSIGFVNNNNRYRIIEPLYPEMDIHRQAYALAHELGHYYVSNLRSSAVKHFMADCQRATRLKPFYGLFVLLDELKAWKHAEFICIAEGVDMSLFNFSRKSALSTYFKKYWKSIINPLKTLGMSYVVSVAIVLISVSLTDTNIHLPSILDDLKNSIAAESNRTGAVNTLFNIIMLFHFLKWLMGMFFERNTIKDYPFVEKECGSAKVMEKPRP